MNLGTSTDDIGRRGEGGGGAKEKGEDEGQPGASSFPKDGAVKDDGSTEGTTFPGNASKGQNLRCDVHSSTLFQHLKIFVQGVV